MKFTRKPKHLPSTLWIGARKINVRLATLEELDQAYKKTMDKSDYEGSFLGLYLSFANTILLYDGLTEGQMAEVFLHELSHEFFQSRDIFHSEEHVHAVAQGLMSVMVDNPSFFDCMQSICETIRDEKTNNKK